MNNTLLLSTALMDTSTVFSTLSFLTVTANPILKPPLLPCLRRSSSIQRHSPLQIGAPDNADVSPLSGVEPELDSSNDIWHLFKEAQQNILYLNKQRVLAFEELDRVNQEKQELLKRVEQLESEKQVGFGKDRHSSCWELLLWIDSLVLNGMINTSEASDFRKTVMDYKFSVADALCDAMQKGDTEFLAELRQFSKGSKRSGFHIIHICTEMAPLVSVGPLASYVTGISHALQRKGHMVEVILPKYASLDLTEVQGMREIAAESYSYFNGQLHGNRIWTGVVCGIGVTFIEPLYYSSFFNRERVYGYSDDFERFTYFSRASLDYIAKSGKQPDVIHIHNWETSVVGPLFWDIFVKQGLEGTKVLLTCHSLDSQCLEQPDKLALCGLDPARLHRPDRLQDNTKTHLVNVLKGGIVYSNKVMILSSMHSKGRIIRRLNHGLELTLSIHKDKLLVTSYGFDKTSWDPSKDKSLPKNYNAEDIKGKEVCKIALQQQMGFVKDASTILVSCIFSELSDFDMENLKAHICDATVKGAQFILMGSKMPSINRELESLQKLLKDGSMRFISKYDEALSRLIFAASDIILCQSFHDPLLQVPLKALRYGAAPIAFSRGENRFSLFVDHEEEDSTKFARFISSTFGNMSLNQATDEITNKPSRWKEKIVDGMKQDFSWDGECYDLHVSAYTAVKNL